VNRGLKVKPWVKTSLAPGSQVVSDYYAAAEGGITKHFPDGRAMPTFRAAIEYKKEGVPLVVITGKDYGMGSSGDQGNAGNGLTSWAWPKPSN
jgi:aconitase A